MKRNNILLVMAVVILVLMAILSKGSFVKSYTFETMAFQLPEFGILTLAMMLTIVTGGINLSLSVSAALSGIFAAIILNKIPDNPIISIPLAIFICMVAGAFFGIINGALIAFLNIPPILATLGTMTLFEGIGLNITKGGSISGFPQSFFAVGNENIFGIPIPLIIFIFAAIFVFLMLEKTAWGEKVYVVGSNPKVARFSGINNKAILFSIYVFSGVLCSIAGIIIISRYNSGRIDYGSSYLMQSITAVVLGGTSIYGGSGKVSGVVIAVLIIQFLTTGFNTLGISNVLTGIVIGAILILVLAVNHINENILAKSRIKNLQKKNFKV